ncbi:hypothetical protein [Nostoc sp. UHCC 0870]|uniref:hypothetical protein n=1 Tax=Nostoc sp. UHCC 0870 TaxID=2914041 RepID=UPI001EDDEB99|nr:hypothetical protein [Nostoc sp. UHCC 0870]UKO99957.1 hypothetical protein L6494_09740 [Nostoc sp. UHCC 0870]
MSTSFKYSSVAPDTCDLDNITGNHPGYLLEIGERDGGVLITVCPENQVKNPSAQNVYGVFFNPEEAETVLQGLQEAINSARHKNKGSSGHPNRVRQA